MLFFLRLLVSSFVILLVTPIISIAASFDCSKAASETEITICNDPGLSKLDAVLGDLYGIKSRINVSGDDLSYYAD